MFVFDAGQVAELQRRLEAARRRTVKVGIHNPIIAFHDVWLSVAVLLVLSHIAQSEKVLAMPRL